MRILVDGRVLVDRYHGIGRYTYELLRAMPVTESTRWGIVTCGGEDSRQYLPRLAARPDVDLVLSGTRPTSPLSPVMWPALARRWRPDVLFVPYHLTAPWGAVREPVVAVVHDCIFEALPEGAPGRWFVTRYRRATAMALRRSQAVLAISEATSADVKKFYGREADAVVPHGVDASFDAAPLAASAQGARVLHVGARRPHKNQATLLRAFALLLQRVPTASLTLVGSRDPKFPDVTERLVEALELRSSVTVLPWVSEAELLDLYRSSTVFAFPSLVEGFGLPVLEAMAAGLPVVCSDAAAVQEAAQGAARVVPAQDHLAWAAALEWVLTTPGVADQMRTRGYQVARKATWSASALTTLDLLRAQASRRNTRVRP